MRGVLGRWLPPLAWMGLIFVLSAQPQLPSVGEDWFDTVLKKGAHMAGYGILASLYLRALRPRFGSSSRLRWVSWGLAVLYALTDERHQRFVPGRNGTLIDVGIDSVGAGAAMLLHWRLLLRKERAPRESAAQ